MFAPQASSTLVHRTVWCAAVLCSIGVAQAQTLSTRYVDLRRDLLSPSNADVIPVGISPIGEPVGHIVESKVRYDSSTKTYQTLYRRQAVRWNTSGQPTRLAMPADTATQLSNSYAMAANATRVTVGRANDLPAQWSANGQLTALDTRTGAAKAITASGLVGGYVNQPETVNGVTNPNTFRATLWTGGKSQDLHALLGRSVQQGRGSMVVAMNAQGTSAIEESLYMQPQPVACHLVKDGQLTTLPITQGTACSVMGLDDNNRVLLHFMWGQECYMKYPINCPALDQAWAVWEKGAITPLPVKDTDIRSAWMTPDGVVWLQGLRPDGSQGLSTWQNGVLKAVPVTASGNPAGPGETGSGIVAGNSARQFILQTANSTATGGTGSPRVGLLLPR